jgi:Tol biopolymer transport system component
VYERTHRWSRLFTLVPLGMAAAAALTAAVLVAVPKATATFPGPNGRIAFNSDRAGNDDVFSATAAGTGTTNLTVTPTSDRAAEWSPDGRRVVYTRTVASNIDIYIKTVATGRVTRITTNHGVDVSPAWSPDGRRLVFVSSRVGSASGRLDIYLIRAARESRTNRPVRITNTAGDENNPDWSPNGRQIAYDLGVVPIFNIFVVGVNGRGPRPITESAFGVGRAYFDPTWSPDGRQIAFDNGDDIFTIAASVNGGLDCVRCTNLTTTPDTSESDPSWSPNGRLIAFVTTRDRLPDGSANHEIYVMNATDGTGARNVTQNPAHDDSPAWGPRPRR